MTGCHDDHGGHCDQDDQDDHDHQDTTRRLPGTRRFRRPLRNHQETTRNTNITLPRCYNISTKLLSILSVLERHLCWGFEGSIRDEGLVRALGLGEGPKTMHLQPLNPKEPRPLTGIPLDPQISKPHPRTTEAQGSYPKAKHP